MRRLGHTIVTWDEEALVHLPDEIYYSRRLSPEVLAQLSHLFAWGEDNADLWRRYPGMPEGMPIHITGNPRSDLLRPELLPFYQEEADHIRGEHGQFILVNTNFNHVNAFYAAQNLFVSPPEGGAPKFGKAGVGMTLEFAEALRDQKQAVFEAFQELIPSLHEAFPEHRIIVRPHPTEGQEVYEAIAARCSRVRVTNQGNVVPWLMGASALVHNGCTTGVEAFAMGVPAISYRPRVDERIDAGFYRLPHGVSHQCFELPSVIELLGQVFQGGAGPAEGPERRALFEHFMAAMDGPTACERIVDVVAEVAGSERGLPRTSFADRLRGWSQANGRRVVKRCKVMLPSLRERARFYRHRYPEVSVERIRDKVARFEQLIGDAAPVRVRAMAGGIFRIDPSNS